MTEAAQPADILSAVLSRFQRLSETPLALHLSGVKIGPSNLWEALRYEIAETIYDELYRERIEHESSKSKTKPYSRRRQNIRSWMLRNLWQGQLSEEFLVGLLSARFGFVGDVMEKGHTAFQRNARRHFSGCDILVAGSFYRTPVTVLDRILQRLESHHGLEHLVIAHDDVLLRHARAFRRLGGMRWLHAATFSSREQQAISGEFVTQGLAAMSQIKNPAEPELPDVIFDRFLSSRYLKRLAWNFLAVQQALSQCNASVVVIPDERQPLARLVGLEARQRGLQVVSALLPLDQIYRKTPLWGPIVSTRILVFSPIAARFLGRAGAPPDLFECTNSLKFEMETYRNRATLRVRFRESLGLPADSPIVLFASQGRAINEALVPMVKACVQNIPVRLVIRPHPNESNALVKLMNPGVIVSRAFTAREAIQAADVLVTHSSFMAVEASMLGCPVVLVSPDFVPSLTPLLVEGLARWARTTEELRLTLEDLLANRDGSLLCAQELFMKETREVAGPERAASLIAELARAQPGIGSRQTSKVKQ